MKPRQAVSRAAAGLLAAICLALPAPADPLDPAEALLDALALPEIIEIMREEGIAYGDEMAGDLVPRSGAGRWQQALSAIYDEEDMERVVRERFRDSFEGTDATDLLAFFRGETGERIVALELSARRALIDDDVERMARESFRGLDGSSDARLGLVRDFVAANDLVEANVVGALNASYQFYLGLVDGGALEMTDEEIVTEVWSQESDMRADTREWLFGYLLMAYGPLPEETMQAYTDLSATPEGRAMNRALFDGFNAMYDRISYALGRAAARQMMTQDL